MTNNNPFDLLMEEHKVISAVNEIIQHLDGSWNEDPEQYVEKVDTLIEFCKEYSDHFHHRKEEEVLFKELRNHPDFLLDSILDELEGHHEMFRDTVEEIEEYLQDADYKRVQTLLTNYMNDLLDHIAVENDELFISSEALFSDDEQERIFFLFKDIDLELGEDVKQRLADNIKKL